MWASHASEVLGELQIEKVHVHDNTVKHGQCVLCVHTHSISIIMVIATLVRYSSHWDTAVCTR